MLKTETMTAPRWPAVVVDVVMWSLLLGLIIWVLRTGGCSWN